MSYPPSDADLARYRALVHKSLVETVHNERTDEDVLCRIDPGAPLTPPGLQQFEPLPGWKLVTDWDQDVQQNDNLVHARRGTFHVLTTISDDAFPYDLTATMMQTKRADGSSPFPGTETVTFVNAHDESDTVPNVPAWVHQVGQDLRLQGITIAWDWEAVYPTGIHFAEANREPFVDDIIRRVVDGETRDFLINNRPVDLVVALPLKRATMVESP